MNKEKFDNLDVIKIAEKINNHINLLGIMRKEIRQRADDRANAIALYDKALAIAIIKLKNGEVFELDGNEIKNPIGSITEKIAKGICWKEKLNIEKGDGLYKSLISNIDSVKAELNGMQSIYRHLEGI